MNTKQRQAIAERMAAIAQACGANVTIEDQKQHRCHYVTADFDDVFVSFEIDTLFRGGIMCHWYGAKRDLTLAPFDSINECHKRKATQYRDTPDAFATAFQRACEAVADGSAFA